MGWKKDFVDNSVPFLPISGWIGDNLIKASENMKWWKPVEIKSLSGKGHPVRPGLPAASDLRPLVAARLGTLMQAWNAASLSP